MAISVNELAHSRVGHSQGLHGVSDYTTAYYVKLSTAGQDPVAIIRDGAYGWTGTRIPIGSRHPHNNNLISMDYRFVDILAGNPLHCVVVITYGTPLILATGGKWAFKIHGSLSSEHVDVDADGVGIGSVDYGEPLTGNFSPFVTAKNPKGSDFDFKFKDPLGAYSGSLDDVSQSTSAMRQIRRTLPRRSLGTERKKGVQTVQFSVDVPTFQIGPVSDALTAHRFAMMNSSELVVSTIAGGRMKFGPARSFHMSEFGISPAEGFLANQAIPNLYWHIELAIEAAPNGQAYHAYHKYTDPATSTEHPIIASQDVTYDELGNPIESFGIRREAFRLYDLADFTAIMNQLIA